MDWGTIKAWWTVALVSLVMVNGPERLLGQARASGGSRPPAAAAGSSRPSSPSRPRVGPSRPSPPSTHQPFTSTMLFAPTPDPFAGRHGAFPFRSSRFGLVLLAPLWPWALSDVDQAFVPQPAPFSVESISAGGLQLDVEPRRAQVYADGWYLGVVDDFSGYYHHLEIGAGSHIIELFAPDYEPLIVRVTVSPGRTTTYRGSLNRAPTSY
jgi:hypothetical protein